MFDFVMGQIGYSGAALDPSRVEEIALYCCGAMVVTFGIMAGILFMQVIRRMTGGIKK